MTAKNRDMLAFTATCAKISNRYNIRIGYIELQETIDRTILRKLDDQQRPDICRNCGRD